MRLFSQTFMKTRIRLLLIAALSLPLNAGAVELFTFYAECELGLIDTIAETSTPVGTIGWSVEAMDYGPDGQLYATVEDGCWTHGNADTLAIIDPVTLTVTPIGPIDPGGLGFGESSEMSPPSTPPMPVIEVLLTSGQPELLGRFAVIVQCFRAVQVVDLARRCRVEDAGLGPNFAQYTIVARHLLGDLLGNRSSLVAVRDHRPGDLQSRIDPLLEKPHCFVQVNQSAKLESARLDDYANVRRGGQAVDRQHAERWRAIENDRCVFRKIRIPKAGLQDELAARLGHELRFASRQVDAAWRDRQVLGHLNHGQRRPIAHRRIESPLGVGLPECAGQARLRVHVDKMRAHSGPGHQYPKCGGGRRLGRAAFLVRYRDDDSVLFCIHDAVMPQMTECRQRLFCVVTS